MKLDLTDLRLFIHTAEEGALTRAAARHHLSLPAASARVKALEQQAGVALLYREARGVRLTPAGDAFLHHARAMLRQAEHLRTDLRDYGGGLRGHVRVYANTTAVSDFLPQVLRDFLAAHPRVNVELQERTNTDIARGVRDGRADLGIVAGGVDLQGLDALHYATDSLVLAVPQSHPLAAHAQVPFVDTLEYDHVGMHEGSTLHRFLLQLTEQMGRTLRLRIQLFSFDEVCRMIGAGVGIGVVPNSVVQRNLDSMGLACVQLQDEWRWRERRILTRSGEPTPAYTQALIDLLVAQAKLTMPPRRS